MKKWSVSFYLDTFYHSWVIDAHYEAEAYEKVLRRIPDTCKQILHDLKVEKYYPEW